MDEQTAAYLRERRSLSGRLNIARDAVSGLIGAFIVAFVPTNPTPSQTAMFATLGAIGGIVLVEVSLYLWRFIWVAPKQMHFATLGIVDRLDKELESTRAQLVIHRKDQALADALTEKHAEGVREILNKPPLHVNDINRWRAEADAWKQQVLSIMEIHSCTKQDLNHVETIGIFNVLPLHDHPTARNDLSMFVERLNRVANISTKYAK